MLIPTKFPLSPFHSTGRLLNNICSIHCTGGAADCIAIGSHHMG